MSKWIWELIRLILSVTSPEIRAAFCAMLNDLEQKAKETKNPWDDVLVGLLKTILACPEK